MKPSEHIPAEHALLGVLSGKGGDNPFRVFAELRQMGSVIQIPIPMGTSENHAWVVTHLEEALKVVKDQTSFCVNPKSIGGGQNHTLALTGNEDASGSGLFLTTSLNAIDEPDHRRLRTLVSKAFTPRYMESLRPRVQQLADALLDRVQDQGAMDLVKDFAAPLPINVISDMIGVPASDHSKIHELSNGIANGLGLGRQDQQVTDSLKEFEVYIRQLIDNKRKQPSDDLISQLISIEEQGDRLDEKELISLIQLLIFAGHETTSTLISTGALMLLDHPEQLELLKARPELVPSAVEELLRYNGPSTVGGPRYAIKDVELGGKRIKKGDLLLPLFKSANRDEQEFTNAEELDITRKINRHLAFGQGIHICLGAPLARIEADVAFTTLLKRMPNLKLSIPREDIRWQFKLASQGLIELPVSF